MPRPLLTRSAARAIAALCGLAPCVLALSGLTPSDAAASVAGARQPGVTVPVSVSITSVSPDFARPGRPVTVSGTLTNTSRKTITGLSVQLRSSQFAFSSRGALQEYADDVSSPDSTLNGAVRDLTRPLAPRATVRWSITLRGSQLPMTAFGVYPLAAQATSADQTPLAVSRTFLPFWTGQESLGDPLRQDVAWIWPLIDQPRQAVCPALLNNGLAASFGSGGRLAGLLDAGRAYSAAARLTWAIDPALLANATTMSKPYHTGGVAVCNGSPRQAQPRAEPASRAATAWLAGLKSATAGQQVFVTPYDDADIAPLTRYSLNADLSHAFTEGRLVAGQALGRSFSTTAGGTATGANGIAWPADGSANRADLANLAASDGIKTVVLDSSAMPPSSPQVHYTPSAQTTTRDRTRSGMTVLLSDDTLTQIIGSANSASDSPAQKFSIEQRYLAETAMIAAERPHLARSIVVAPPRHWDPSADLASDLLDETVRAPWLQPVSLAMLAAVRHPAGGVRRQAPPETVRGARLGRSLVSQVRQLDQQVQLLKSIQRTPPPGLDRGIFAIESSAWRGAHAGQQALAQQISADLALQESRLKIHVTPREQLTGKTGTVRVSISNRLNYDVLVRLQADPGAGVTVKRQPGAVRVPHGMQVIVPLQVTATAVGSTALTLSLLTPGGTPIPGAHASVTIQATRYGTLALVIIAAVLGAFVISSGIRTFRRRRRRSRDGAASADPAGPAPGPAEDAAPAPPDASPAAHHAARGQADWPAEPEKSDTVVSDRIRTRRASPGHDPAEVEEPDDYAWARGSTDRR